jgi:hypothetical protein
MATCRTLRHNRAMPRLLPASVLLLCLALAACDAPSPSSRAPGARVPALDAGGGRIEWQGSLPCADCDAIDTRLLLQRNGATRNYTLTEVYLASDGGARFVENGHWRQDRALLRLQDAAGSRRAYALLPDGRLQPRDWHGRPLSPGADDFLVPITATTAP